MGPGRMHDAQTTPDYDPDKLSRLSAPIDLDLRESAAITWQAAIIRYAMR
jgi:hypothetical protein